MTETPTSETEFVFGLLERVGDPDAVADRLREIGNDLPDWEVILELASRHRLHSPLRRTLESVAVDHPRSIDETLDAQHRRNSIENLRHSRQLCDIIDLFESNDIEATPYKGPILAEAAYGSIGDRSFGDLDLLVAPDDVRSAAELLERHGYERTNFSDIPVETLVNGTVFRWGKEFRFVDRDGGLPVELRFGFIGGRRSDHSIFADLLDRRTPTDLAGRTVPALSPEDRALLLLVHGTKHGWRQLSWVYDVALVLAGEREIDWEAVTTRARQYHWLNAVLYGVSVVTELTGLSVPDPVRSELESSRLCSVGARRTVAMLRADPMADLTFLEPITTAAFLNDNLRGSVTDAVNEVLAPRKADYQWLPLPPRFHRLYYLTRPCHLCVSTIKRIARR
ncbi:nucleotidyltransferase family protein [Halorubrum ejinorense]|uniref:Nucleotidyltransferase family protein n=1 Tax=Halorubrum ejinorense TaxID=425309 RepID=A0AAV3SSH3_9EURY